MVAISKYIDVRELASVILPTRKDLNLSWLKKKLNKHFLPLGFLVALIFALSWDAPGKEVASWKWGDWKVIQTICVCLIFIISGITLRTQDIKDAVAAWASFLYASAAILAITPVMGFAAIAIPFHPEEFRRGLALFATVPTTLTSGVTLVTQGGGNRALALMLTVTTNLAGVVTVPFMLGLVMSSSDVSIDALDLLKKLILTILVPLAIGKALLQFVPPVEPFTQRHKTALSITSSSALIIIVWQTLSASAAVIKGQSGASISIMILAAVILHVVYLATNYAATWLLKTSEPEAKAVIIMASQKTLPVALSILANLKVEEIGSPGLVAIPCIVGHITQLFMDSVLVSHWAYKVEQNKAARQVTVEDAPRAAEDVDVETAGGSSSKVGLMGPGGSLGGDLAGTDSEPSLRWAPNMSEKSPLAADFGSAAPSDHYIVPGGHYMPSAEHLKSPTAGNGALKLLPAAKEKPHVTPSSILLQMAAPKPGWDRLPDEDDDD